MSMHLSCDEITLYKHRVASMRDAEAFKILFRNFYGPLCHFAEHVLQDQELAQEVVANVLIGVWQMGSKLLYVENLEAYLFTITFNDLYKNSNKINNESISLDVITSFFIKKNEFAKSNIFKR